MACTLFRRLCLAAGLVTVAASAQAQLAQSQVLVVYDSRIPDSREVAAYYAGSAKVPGNPNVYTGKRPGVQVLDLANAPGGTPPVFTFTDITRDQFVTSLRTPLRNFLNVGNRAREIRCIVLTKGLPHRIRDFDVPNAGDDPNLTVAEFNAGDQSNASVDSELCMLYYNNVDSENGLGSDSFSDGGILNPFWRSTKGINAYPNDLIKTPKTLIFAGGAPGQVVTTARTQPALTPGDMYLVCRLDARTTANVRAIIDRAQNIFVDTLNTAFVLDEVNSNGFVDTSPNSEYDNQSFGNYGYSGDDYEKTRDLLLADKRFAAGNVRYNGGINTAPNFLVGPRIAYNPAGTVVNPQVILLASVGSNTGPQSGQPQISGVNAGQNYADSFNYAPGAIFNTIESYNGRDFGGIGGWTGGWGPQEQAADFLAAGGTFAIVNVWEPFAFSLPDNEWLVRNFILGQMNFAEAAYTALPFLSYQQMVVGDPLAFVVRSSEDLNADGRVDVEDLYTFEQSPADINLDGVANDADRQILLASVRRFEAIPE